MQMILRSHMQLLMAFVMALAMTACATNGTPAQKFNAAAANTLQSADEAVTLTRTLLRADKVTSDEAEYVLKLATTAREGVAAARKMFNSTEPGAGETAATQRLRLAASVLDQLQQYLVTKQAGGK